MNDIQLQQPVLRRVLTGPENLIPNDQVLEQTIGISMIEDLDRQLSQIANQVKDQTGKKQALRSEIQQIQDILSRPIINGLIEITEEERNKLGLGQTNTVSKESLRSLADKKQDELAGLNSNSEIMMIQVQSLVDQRKNSISLLSNLIASRNESLMGIIRNIKN